MRRAVIIAPRSTEGAVIPCAVDGERARGCLGEAGYAVSVLDPTEDLAEQLDALLAADRLGAADALILYAAAIFVLGGDGEALLCLDPDDLGTVDSLRELALTCKDRAACPTLFLLELRHPPAPSDAFAAVGVTRAARDAVGPAAVSLAVAARSLDPTSEAGCSPLTEELARAIADADPAVGLSFEQFQAELDESEVLLGRVPSYAHLGGASSVPIVAIAAPGPASVPPAAAPPEPAAAPAPVPAAKREATSAFDADRPRAAPRSVPPAAPSIPRAQAADLVVSGERKLQAGELEAALSDFKKALILAKPTEAALRTAIYVGVGEVYLRQDRAREAIPSFEKALGLTPDHPRAREALLDSSVMLRDWRAVALAEDRLLTSADDPDRVLELLIASGTRWLQVADDTQRARARLEAARELAPTERIVLQRLCEIYDKTRSIKEALEVRRELARISPDPRERAEQYFALGEHQRLELLQEDPAIELYEAALESDPTFLEPLAIIARLLAERQEWGALEAAYRAAIARSERLAPSASRAQLLAELWRRLGLLFRDHLEDPEAALSAVESAVVAYPEDASTRALAADLALSIDAIDRQAEHLQALIALEPRRSEAYHELFEALEHLERHALAARVAASITYLGASEARERAIADGLPKGPLAPTRPLDDEGWRLIEPPSDGLVDAILTAVAPAAIAARAAHLASPLPDPRRRQNPAESTVSAMRSLAWAAHFLGVELPAVYVGEGDDFAFTSGLTAEPTLLVGGKALRGRSLGELAFLSGRYLARERGSARLTLYFPTLDELSACFVAALAVVREDIVFPAQLAATAAPLRTAVARIITPEARAELTAAVEALDRSGAPADLGAWLGGVERTSARAGYLLSTDLATAAALLEADPGGALSPEQALRDVLSFSVSSAHEALLARMLDS